MLKCKDGMLVSGGMCSKCPPIEGSEITPYCDGTILFQCYNNQAEKKVVLQFGEGGNKSCGLCPENATCDGVSVVRCDSGQMISEDKKSCGKCGGDSVCDGFGQSSCSQVEGAAACKDGVVQSCKKNYKISEDRATCEINKAQGACGLGCVIGVFIAVVAVIGLVVGLLLVLYFKNQRAKIAEILYLSNNGRGVDLTMARVRPANAS